MVNNRRSELDIIGDIIHLSQNGAKKTQLLYQGNLSYSQLNEYLFFLLDKNILEEVPVNNGNGNGHQKIYKCTEKGHNLLLDINKTMSYFR